jgi:acetyl esterase/lipase
MFTVILFGILMGMVGLIIALVVGNIVILVMLQDIPWLRLLGARGKVVRVADIAYVEGSPHPKHRLDLYLPKGEKKFPVVHFLHGGYWVSGDKQYYLPVTGLYANIGNALAKEGIGVVVQNYRLAPEAKFDEILGDALKGLAWTQANIGKHGGDPDRVFLMGHSAGGHMTALLAADQYRLAKGRVDAEKIKGYVALSAIFDLADMERKNGRQFNDSVTHKVFGDDPAALVRHSPVTHVKGGMPPMLVMIGENDFPYLIPQGLHALDLMASTGNVPTYVVVPGYAHMDLVLHFGRNGDPVAEHVVRFVRGTK